MTGYTTLDHIVRSLLADEGYHTLHYYLRYLHFALEGEKDWRTDYGLEIKSKELQVNPDLTVDFPRDLSYWSKIAVPVGDRLVAFLNDSTLNTDPECLNDQRQPYFDEIINAKGDYYEFNNYYKSLSGSFTAMSVGAKFPGYFAVDESKRRFIMSDEVTAKTVILEYVPDQSCGPSGKTYINKKAERLMKFYIQWRYAENKFGPESARAAAWERRYIDEHDLLLRRLNPLQYEDIKHITRKYNTTGLKA